MRAITLKQCKDVHAYACKEVNKWQEDILPKTEALNTNLETEYEAAIVAKTIDFIKLLQAQVIENIDKLDSINEKGNEYYRLSHVTFMLARQVHVLLLSIRNEMGDRLTNKE